MSPKYLLIIGIITLMAVGAGVYYFLFLKCPVSCDDGNSCTAESCSKETGYKCQIKPIPNCCGNKTCETGEVYDTCAIDCPTCDDNNKCTKDSFDYNKQACKNFPILDTVCCGNTVCETGENYQNCSRDCVSCDDDNKCTKDSYDYNRQTCLNKTVIPCCGNNICDKGAETSSNCSADCLNCNDNNKLTADKFNYTTQKCENVATHYFVDDFENGAASWDFYSESLPADVAWSTAKENGNTILRGKEHNWATLRGMSWNDYIFKARFKVIKGDIHFNYRLKQMGEQPNRYFVGLGSGGHLILNKQTQDVFYNNLAESYGLNFGTGWHTMEIRALGNIFNILVDGQLLLKYKDADAPHLGGGIGIETHDNSEYWIDDVEIKVISEKDIIYP